MAQYGHASTCRLHLPGERLLHVAYWSDLTSLSGLERQLAFTVTNLLTATGASFTMATCQMGFRGELPVGRSQMRKATPGSRMMGLVCTEARLPCWTPSPVC